MCVSNTSTVKTAGNGAVDCREARAVARERAKKEGDAAEVMGS